MVGRTSLDPHHRIGIRETGMVDEEAPGGRARERREFEGATSLMPNYEPDGPVAEGTVSIIEH